MSEPVDPRDASLGAVPLLARAAAAELRGHRRIGAAADHFFRAEDARIDDRTFAALDGVMRAMVAGVEGGIRDHGARLLAARGEPGLADALASAPPIFDRLLAAGLFRDPALFGELLARIRLEGLEARLPALAPDVPDRPSLLARMAQAGDRVVAAAAVAMLAAQARRAAAADPHSAPGADLPASLHRRLAWWVAAALRDVLFDAAGARLGTLDRAIADSVRRAIDAQEEPRRLELVAMRLAAAIDPQPDEMPMLVEESIADRRLALFVALIAHAAGLGYERVRAILIDNDAERLWIVLRALGLPRATLARVGFALCEADATRDLEAFADTIDTLAAIDAQAARAAMAPLALDPDYHAAMLAFGTGRVAA